MKAIVLGILVFITFNFSYSQSLSGTVTYRATIIESHRIYPVAPQELKVLEMKSGKNAVPLNFTLSFNDKESLYFAEQSFQESQKLRLLMNETAFVAKNNNIYYTNIKVKEKFYKTRLTKDIMVKMDDVKWELTKETKKIGKYICYKAITTIASEQTHGMGYISPIIAWYTPEIPVSFGIQNFTGLPGLTLELLVDFQNAKILYEATHIELGNEVKIEKPKTDSQISEKEYVELIQEMNNARRAG